MDDEWKARTNEMAVAFLHRVMKKAGIDDSGTSDEKLSLIAELVTAQTGWHVLDGDAAKRFVDIITQVEFTRYQSELARNPPDDDGGGCPFG